jgi:cytochrome b6-f complex iron-sulfur subunit
MDRKEFLNALGLGAAAIAVFNCVGCAKTSGGEPATSAPTNIDFTLDLNATTNAALKNNGGYLYANGVIVAKTTAGNFIAVQQSCTHQTYNLTYRGAQQQFYCPNHGAQFSETGVSAGIETKINLKTYKTQLSGTNLRIYS